MLFKFLFITTRTPTPKKQQTLITLFRRHDTSDNQRRPTTSSNKSPKPRTIKKSGAAAYIHTIIKLRSTPNPNSTPAHMIPPQTIPRVPKESKPNIVSNSPLYKNLARIYCQSIVAVDRLIKKFERWRHNHGKNPPVNAPDNPTRQTDEDHKTAIRTAGMEN